MTPSDWIDMLAVPPRPLPAKLDEAVAYLSDVLHVPVYTRWTPSALLQRYGSMPAAKAALPDVFALLLAGTPVVQFWNAGQLQTLPESRAPSVDIVVHRLLQVMRVRFRRATSDASRPGGAGSANATPAARMAASDSLDGEVWLARSGHLLNRNAASNSLGVQDDASAVRTFIRDRAGASAHTRRAYVCEIRRFIRWCEDKGITGPFSGLSRDDVIRYRDQFPAAQAATRGALREPADSTRRRALAVIRSLTSYLWKTGYLSANPAAGLGSTAAARAQFSPDRILPAGAVRAIDDWLLARLNQHDPPPAATRRAAIVAVYRFSGIRLDELAWRDGFPQLVADETGWTMHVKGKGQRVRSIPLPDACVMFLRQYRLACGRSIDPAPRENLPLIHGQRNNALGPRGLYDEVRKAFAEMAASVPEADVAARLALQEASPHWLRHLVGRTLVIDAQTPLPVAQVLLGHQSVATTATYARADTSRLRQVMQESFGMPLAQAARTSD